MIDDLAGGPQTPPRPGAGRLAAEPRLQKHKVYVCNETKCWIEFRTDCQGSSCNTSP